MGISLSPKSLPCNTPPREAETFGFRLLFCSAADLGGTHDAR